MFADREKVKQLMMCSMYWGLDMMASLKELLEDETIQCDEECKEIFGQRVSEILKGQRNVSFLEYAAVCEDISGELKILNARDANLFSTNMEALLFFTSQITRLVRDTNNLIILLGFKDDANSMMNELGSEVMGLEGQRSKVVV